jgi:hypothetical protein
MGQEHSMKELVISVAILRYSEGWRVVADGGPMGRYADQADAEGAAQRFAAASQGSGRPIEMLLQDPQGELHRFVGHGSTVESPA